MSLCPMIDHDVNESREHVRSFFGITPNDQPSSLGLEHTQALWKQVSRN
jgi:hypothetical protein